MIIDLGSILTFYETVIIGFEHEESQRLFKRVWLLLFDVYLRGLTGTYG